MSEIEWVAIEEKYFEYSPKLTFLTFLVVFLLFTEKPDSYKILL